MRRRTPPGILAALALGYILAGVFAALLISANTRGRPDSLADLGTGSKEKIAALVSEAYACDHDLDKARAQLDLLGVPSSGQWLAELVDRTAQSGGDERVARNLAALANALGMSSPRVLAYLATATPTPTLTEPLPPTRLPTSTPVPTRTPAPTETPRKTRTPAPTEPPVTSIPSVPPASSTPRLPTKVPKPKATSTPTPTPSPTLDFVVKEARLLTMDEGGCCTSGYIKVEVFDSDGVPLDGIRVHMVWSSLSGAPDPPSTGFKGPGCTEHVMFGGGEQVTITGHDDGRTFSSETTQPLRFRNPGPAYEQLVAANCCGSQQDRGQIGWDLCQSGFDCGGHWPYIVRFQATHRIRP